MFGKLISNQFIVLIIGVILLGQIQCQFLLFPAASNAPKNSQPATNQENDVSIDNEDLSESESFESGLTLFPNLKSSSNHCDKMTCKDYCENRFNVENTEDNQLKQLIEKTIKLEIQANKTLLNLNTVQYYYKDLIQSILVPISISKEEEENIAYKIEIQLNRYEISKLELFLTKNVEDELYSEKLHDATEVLKKMLVAVEYSRILSVFEMILANSSLIETIVGYLIILAYLGFYWHFNKRLSIVVFWIKFAIYSFTIAFWYAVFKNHAYLNEIKKIASQQKAKGFIPDICFQENNSKSEGHISKFFSGIGHHIWYRPDSQICLDYQEALFVLNTHDNYIETIVYTIGQILKQTVKISGECIPLFYTALGKNLNFLQHTGMISLFTLYILPIGAIIFIIVAIIFTSMHMGYGMSFFYLISFYPPNNRSQRELQLENDRLQLENVELKKQLELTSTEAKKSLAIKSSSVERKNKRRRKSRKPIDSSTEVLSSTTEEEITDKDENNNNIRKVQKHRSKSKEEMNEE